MAIYYVQQKITQWVQVPVNAENLNDALEVGQKLLNEGGGENVDTSFEWCDAFAVVDEDGLTIYQNENE